jgi:hypothetical protein
MQATGFELPASSTLDLRFVNAATGASLHTETVTTKADGSIAVKVPMPLDGVRSVRMERARPGVAKPFAFSEMTIAGPCPLPFTGPARAPALLGVALACWWPGPSWSACPPTADATVPSGRSGRAEGAAPGAPSCAWCRRPGPRACGSRHVASWGRSVTE